MKTKRKSKTELSRAPAFLAVPVCLTTVLVLAALRVHQRSGYGMGDLVAVVFWTVPLAVILWGMGSLFFGSWERQCAIEKWTLAIFLGGVCGYLWKVVVAIQMGPWFGAFSFPMAILWIVGGAAGLLVANIGFSFVNAGLKGGR